MSGNKGQAHRTASSWLSRGESRGKVFTKSAIFYIIELLFFFILPALVSHSNKLCRAVLEGDVLPNLTRTVRTTLTSFSHLERPENDALAVRKDKCTIHHDCSKPKYCLHRLVRCHTRLEMDWTKVQCGTSTSFFILNDTEKQQNTKRT